MFTKQRIVMVLIVVGLFLAAVGLLADVIGVGEDTENFGDRQILVTAVGFVIAFAGVGVHVFGDRFLGAQSTDEGTTAAEE